MMMALANVHKEQLLLKYQIVYFAELALVTALLALEHLNIVLNVFLVFHSMEIIRVFALLEHILILQIQIVSLVWPTVKLAKEKIMDLWFVKHVLLIMSLMGLNVHYHVRMESIIQDLSVLIAQLSAQAAFRKIFAYHVLMINIYLLAVAEATAQ